MRLKLFLFSALLIILLFSFGCSHQTNNEIPKESTPVVTNDTTMNTTAPADTTTRPMPPTPPIATTFTDIRTMKSELEAKSESHSIDLPALKELDGLDEEYPESWVEWAGGSDYYIYYTKEDAAVAFMPFSSEEDLQIHMTNLLKSSETYELLIANPKVSNVQKADITTETGTAYECSYDTSLKMGLKIRYYEYTDPASGITYILSESFDSDSSLQSGDLFVFDGENAFMCNCLYTSLTISEAMELSSKTVS